MIVKQCKTFDGKHHGDHGAVDKRANEWVVKNIEHFHNPVRIEYSYAVGGRDTVRVLLVCYHIDHEKISMLTE